MEKAEKNCAYCGKPIEDGKAHAATIIYRNGSGVGRKTQDYCSERCASHDQMAHEG